MSEEKPDPTSHHVEAPPGENAAPKKEDGINARRCCGSTSSPNQELRHSSEWSETSWPPLQIHPRYHESHRSNR